MVGRVATNFMRYHKRDRLKRSVRIGVIADDRYVKRLVKQGYSTAEAVKLLYYHMFDAWLHAPEPLIPNLAVRPKKLILPRKIWFEQWNKDG